MKRIESLLLLAPLVLVGCATAEKFNLRMNEYMGRSEAELVGRLGPPQSVYTLDDGSKVLTYTRGSSVFIPGAVTTTPVTTNTTGRVNVTTGLRQSSGTYTQQSTTYVQQQQPGTAVNLYCTVHFTLHWRGYLQSWRSEGNNCVAS